MSDRSKKSKAKTLTDTDKSTSSQESQDGRKRSDLPDGRQADLFGQEVVPVSRSAQREREKAKRMSGIYGRTSFASSASVALQSCLASRLAETMDTDGSPEFKLTWKRRTMPSGLRICRLVASARRTSGSGCTGWPTPDGSARGEMGPEAAMRRIVTSATAAKRNINLQDVAQLAGWVTPQARDAKGVTQNYSRADKKKDDSLVDQVLSGWATPRAADAESAETRHSRRVADTLTAQSRLLANMPDTLSKSACGLTTGQSVPVELTGWPTPNAMEGGATSRSGDRKDELLFGGLLRQSFSQTGKRGVLNPFFSLYLMGYPVLWGIAGALSALKSKRK